MKIVITATINKEVHPSRMKELASHLSQAVETAGETITLNAVVSTKTHIKH